jgi:hypothetical protein
VSCFEVVYNKVRSLLGTDVQCELAVMRKAMHATEEVQSPLCNCCESARSAVNWFVVVEHSRGYGLPSASRAVRPAAASAPVLSAQALACEVVLKSCLRVGHGLHFASVAGLLSQGCRFA